MDNNPEIQPIPPQSIPPQSAPQTTSNHPKTALLIGGLVILFLVLTVGVFYLGAKKNNSQQLARLTQSTISPSPTTSSTTDPTINWKTYQDSQYNLAFKYPNSWIFKQLASFVNTQKTVGFKNKLLGTEVYPGDFTFSYIITTQTLDALIAQTKKDIPEAVQTNTTIAGIIATKFTYGNAGQGVEVLVSNGGITYEFVGDNTNQYATQILSTLRFTSSSPQATKNGITITAPQDGSIINRNFVLTGTAPKGTAGTSLSILIDGKEYLYPESRSGSNTSSPPPIVGDDGSFSITMDLNGSQVTRVISNVNADGTAAPTIYGGVSTGKHTFQVSYEGSLSFPKIDGPTLTLDLE